RRIFVICSFLEFAHKGLWSLVLPRGWYHILPGRRTVGRNRNGLRCSRPSERALKPRKRYGKSLTVAQVFLASHPTLCLLTMAQYLSRSFESQGKKQMTCTNPAHRIRGHHFALLAATALLGCSTQQPARTAPQPPAVPEQPAEVVAAPPNKDAAPGKSRAATETTRAKNDALLQAYPFADKQDFENAKKGLIAPLPNEGVIKDAQGKVVWNLKAFSDYIKQGEKAPETVNPSLW